MQDSAMKLYSGKLAPPVFSILRVSQPVMDASRLAFHVVTHEVVCFPAFSRALIRSNNAESRNGCGASLESKTVTALWISKCRKEERLTDITSCGSVSGSDWNERLLVLGFARRVTARLLKRPLDELPRLWGGHDCGVGIGLQPVNRASALRNVVRLLVQRLLLELR